MVHIKAVKENEFSGPFSHGLRLQMLDHRLVALDDGRDISSQSGHDSLRDLIRLTRIYSIRTVELDCCSRALAEHQHSAFRTDLTMLLGTGGLERTEREYRALFASSDIALERLIPNASEFAVLVGRVDRPA